MAVSARLETLNVKHVDLDMKIQAEMRSPMPDTLRISELKRQKLLLKRRNITVKNGGGLAFYSDLYS